MGVDEELRSAVARAAGLLPRDLADENEIADQLGISSIDLISIYGYFEDKYAIIISDEEAERVKTLGDLRELVESKVAQTGG
jgi:acyl carrier protein